jgi:hypothetical protein
MSTVVAGAELVKVYFHVSSPTKAKLTGLAVPTFASAVVASMSTSSHHMGAGVNVAVPGTAVSPS